MKRSFMCVLACAVTACAPRGQGGAASPVSRVPIEVDGAPPPVVALDAGALDAPDRIVTVDAALAEGGALATSAVDLDASPAVDRGPIELADYGLDPSYRRPRLVITAEQGRLLDEVQRLARVYAQDPPSGGLYRHLGRPVGMVDRGLLFESDVPGIEAIVLSEAPSDEGIELRLVEPVLLAVLATRFGPIEEVHLPDNRGDPVWYESRPVTAVGAFAVRVRATFEFAPRRRADELTRVVYLHRRRKPPAAPAPPVKPRGRARPVRR